MSFRQEFKKKLLSSNTLSFSELALLLCKYQAKHNSIYSEFINHLKIDVTNISKLEEIPFMPISFFKTQEIKCGNDFAEYVFESSGTTGQNTSRHLVSDLNFYLQNSLQLFESYYGNISKYTIFALLPSYLERQNSSLVFMTDFLINKSYSIYSGYYLYNHEELAEQLNAAKLRGDKVILIGVTYALLDFAEKHQLDFPELIVMETGGMKGRRKEMIRSEVHEILKPAFGVQHIHSEYGMTELLSQAYSSGNGLFKSSKTLKIGIREATDPFDISFHSKRGAINVIDLANVDSCAFLATEDQGILHPDGSFEINGRLDNSDIRGCNLMITNQ